MVLVLVMSLRDKMIANITDFFYQYLLYVKFLLFVV